jgi:hypothetical protein
MKSRTPIVEPPLHGGPRKSVVAVEPTQRIEIGDFDHRGDPSVEIEMQEAARRCGAGDLRKLGLGRVDQFVFVLMHVGREQEEFVVHDVESARRLADATLAQHDELSALGEFPTDHGPLLQGDVVHGLHRG